MDIVQDLRERRGVFQLVTQMMVKVGKVCQEKNMEAAARQSFAAAYVVMEQMDQIDQALAVVDEGVMKVVAVDMVCMKCRGSQNLRAVVNLLVPQEEQVWDDVGCLSCTAHVGHIRHDSEAVAKGYVLTVQGVLDYKKDVRTNEERKPEALVIGKGEEVKASQLPPARDLRAMMLGEVLRSPVVVEHSSATEGGDRGDIKEKLERAKAKIHARGESVQDDF